MEHDRFDADGQRCEELRFTAVEDSPILPVLYAMIDATKPTGLLTYLVTEFGKPFTGNGFGDEMRDWCDAAGLPPCSAHGLRKAGALFASDNGAADQQLISLYGWDSIKQAKTCRDARAPAARAQFHPPGGAFRKRRGTKSIPPNSGIGEKDQVISRRWLGSGAPRRNRHSF